MPRGLCYGGRSDYTHTKIEHVALLHTKNARCGSVHNDIWDNTSPYDVSLVVRDELPPQSDTSDRQNQAEVIAVAGHSNLGED
jgi:hypothetical protein